MDIVALKSKIREHPAISAIIVVVSTVTAIVLNILFLSSYPVIATGLGLLAAVGGIALEIFVVHCCKSTKKSIISVNSPGISADSSPVADKQVVISIDPSATPTPPSAPLDSLLAVQNPETSVPESARILADSSVKPSKGLSFGAFASCNFGCFFAVLMQSFAEPLSAILSREELPINMAYKSKTWTDERYKEDIERRRLEVFNLYEYAQNHEQIQAVQLQMLREDVADCAILYEEDRPGFKTGGFSFGFDPFDTVDTLKRYLALPPDCVSSWDLSPALFHPEIARFKEPDTRTFLLTEFMSALVQTTWEAAVADRKDMAVADLVFPSSVICISLDKIGKAVDSDVTTRLNDRPNMLLFPTTLQYSKDETDPSHCLDPATNHYLESIVVYYPPMRHYVVLVLENDEFYLYDSLGGGIKLKIEGLRALLEFLWEAYPQDKTIAQEIIANVTSERPSLAWFLKNYRIFDTDSIHMLTYRAKES